MANHSTMLALASCAIAAAYSGRTAPGRLKFVDEYLLLRERDALFGGGAGAVFCDVGVGDAASTTLELAAALADCKNAPLVLGLEADGKRADRARASVAGYQNVEVRQTDGRFALPLRAGERCVGARAMNVFRSGYRESDVAPALEALGRGLASGAPLVEGSCSRAGDAGVAHVLRRGDDDRLEREALLFAIDPARGNGFAPMALRPYLPRDLRWHFKRGHGVYGFFEAWTDAWKSSRRQGARDTDDAFRLSARALADDHPVELLAAGLLLWTPAGGVPR